MVDENHGKGGTYIVDPKSGKRTLVEGSRTEPQPRVKPEKEEAPAAPKAETPEASEPAPAPSPKS